MKKLSFDTQNYIKITPNSGPAAVYKILLPFEREANTDRDIDVFHLRSSHVTSNVDFIGPHYHVVLFTCLLQL